MIFEIEEIPDGGLDFNLLDEKEQFEINQPDCSLSGNVRVNGKLTRIEQDIFFPANYRPRLKSIVQDV